MRKWNVIKRNDKKQYILINNFQNDQYANNIIVIIQLFKSSFWAAWISQVLVKERRGNWKQYLHYSNFQQRIHQKDHRRYHYLHLHHPVNGIALLMSLRLFYPNLHSKVSTNHFLRMNLIPHQSPFASSFCLQCLKALFGHPSKSSCFHTRYKKEALESEGQIIP